MPHAVRDVLAALLSNLAAALLGMARDAAFQISVTGAQEKTALLWQEAVAEARGHDAPTHILKTQPGVLPNGINLSDSVENEFF
ncbi:hypothetical protein [Mangrovicoccus ximenensis]|uniref:hypothetical protein n=1 Tax=Mangrovicoccus ximenensis TaxID=1911570 RepID=UPI000D3C1C49|nr:hypothetical protein [Mangrovicoccus ximenensis]